MKHTSLIFALIGLLLAACSPAPVDSQPTPISGVVDISGFPGMDRAHIDFLCLFDSAETFSGSHIEGITGSFDLDQFRPSCDGKVFQSYFIAADELLEAGLGSVTGVVLTLVALESEFVRAPIWPTVPGYDDTSYMPLVFYSNDAGSVKFSGTLSGGGPGITTYAIDAVISPGWNAYAEKAVYSGDDEDFTATIVPLNSVEWIEAPHRGP